MPSRKIQHSVQSGRQRAEPTKRTLFKVPSPEKVKNQKEEEEKWRKWRRK